MEDLSRWGLGPGFLRNIQLPGSKPLQIQKTSEGFNITYLDLETGTRFSQPVDREGNINGPAYPVKGQDPS